MERAPENCSIKFVIPSGSSPSMCSTPTCGVGDRPADHNSAAADTGFVGVLHCLPFDGGNARPMQVAGWE